MIFNNKYVFIFSNSSGWFVALAPKQKLLWVCHCTIDVMGAFPVSTLSNLWSCVTCFFGFPKPFTVYPTAYQAFESTNIYIHYYIYFTVNILIIHRKKDMIYTWNSVAVAPGCPSRCPSCGRNQATQLLFCDALMSFAWLWCWWFASPGHMKNIVVFLLASMPQSCHNSKGSPSEHV